MVVPKGIRSSVPNIIIIRYFWLPFFTYIASLFAGLFLLLVLVPGVLMESRAADDPVCFPALKAWRALCLSLIPAVHAKNTGGSIVMAVAKIEPSTFRPVHHFLALSGVCDYCDD